MVVGINPKPFDNGTFVAEITYGKGVCELMDVENIHYDMWMEVEKTSAIVKECAKGLCVEFYNTETENYSTKAGTIVSRVYTNNQDQLKLFYKKLQDKKMKVYSVKEFYLR